MPLLNQLNSLMPSESELINTICEGIAKDGYVVVEKAFGGPFIKPLLTQLAQLQPGQFKSAGVGRHQDFQTNQQIRGDEIMWVNDDQTACLDYLNWTESLRLALNHRFFLGLFEYECMFAHYSEGAYYQKHLDAFRGQKVNGPNRKVSTILYLNQEWGEVDGGELLLYQPDEVQPFKRILPQLGTFVVFLSEEFPHEVLPAKKSRHSLTGWFRNNG